MLVKLSIYGNFVSVQMRSAADTEIMMKEPTNFVPSSFSSYLMTIPVEKRTSLISSLLNISTESVNESLNSIKVGFVAITFPLIAFSFRNINTSVESDCLQTVWLGKTNRINSKKKDMNARNRV